MVRQSALVNAETLDFVPLTETVTVPWAEAVMVIPAVRAAERDSARSWR